MKQTINIFKKIFFGIFEMFVLAVFSYILFFLLCSPFVDSENIESKDPKTETILISTNGIHSDIILPIRNSLMNWEKKLDISNELAVDTFQTHLKFGWGDKQFFMRTKEWSDMEVSTVLKTVFGRGEGAMHLILCTPKDLDSNTYITIQLSKKEYLSLCSYIAYSFDYSNSKASIIQNHPYGSYDLFFNSTLEYNMFFTCNTWTNNALKQAGQPMAVWTPFKGAIFSKFSD